MKRILVISDCPRRGNGTGMTGFLLKVLSNISNELCEVDLLDTSFFLGHKSSDFDAQCYYSMSSNFLIKVGLSIPRLSSKIKENLVCAKLSKILRHGHHDIVIVHQVQPYSDRIVKISHKYGAKVLLRPWGSEVLRVSEKLKPRLQNAYNNTDYVGGDPDSNVIINAIEVFGVEQKKIVDISFGLGGIRSLIKYKGTKSLEEMSRFFGIPANTYIIVCGYNAYAGQHHREIIEQIASIKQYLPNNYLLVFPMTYGGNDRITYIGQLKQLCVQHGLNSLFFEEFLSAEQMSYLHFLTDIFINVQPTDSGNAFLIEALFCKNKAICGRWLDYPQLQKYGIPYYQCDTIDTLGEIIKGIVAETIPVVSVPEQLIQEWTEKNNITSEDRWTAFLQRI